MVAENGYKPGYPAIGGRGTAPDYVGKFYYDTFPVGFQWGVGGSGVAGDLRIEDVQLLRHLKVKC